MNTMEVINSYWDLRSNTYTNGIAGFKEEERSLWKKILQDSVNNNKDRLKVLDIGTGAGFLALLFAEMGHEVTGIDISTCMLEKAAHNADNLGLHIDLQHGNAESLPFDDCQFDLVVNKYLLWTIPNPEKALIEWKRVLKPNGKIIAIDGDWFNPELNKRFRRGFSNLMARFIQRKNSSVFQKYYSSIYKHLPLYEQRSSQEIYALFNKTGFENTEASPLTEVQEFEKKHSSLLYRIANNNSIFLIKGQKGKE